MSSRKIPNSSNVRPPAIHPAMTSHRVGARIFLVHLFGHNQGLHHRLAASLRRVPSLTHHTRSSSLAAGLGPHVTCVRWVEESRSRAHEPWEQHHRREATRGRRWRNELPNSWNSLKSTLMVAGVEPNCCAHEFPRRTFWWARAGHVDFVRGWPRGSACGRTDCPFS